MTEQRTSGMVIKGNANADVLYDSNIYLKALVWTGVDKVAGSYVIVEDMESPPNEVWGSVYGEENQIVFNTPLPLTGLRIRTITAGVLYAYKE